MKNTQASSRSPTSCRKPGNGPTKKQTEPIANPAATQRSDTGWCACRGTLTSACPIIATTVARRLPQGITRFG
jgi:hypothetical protein